jgi:hypothetical protein
MHVFAVRNLRRTPLALDVAFKLVLLESNRLILLGAGG